MRPSTGSINERVVFVVRGGEPMRYGAAGANLVHPDDSYSYDIYSQIAQGVRDNGARILDGLARRG